MANRRPQMGGNGGRRMEFQRNDQRNDQRKNFGRSGVSPWQGGGPGGIGLPNLLPLAGNGGSTEATLALASNILNLLQPRPNPVPSLLDMPIRRDFVPNMGRFDRSFPPRMGNQGNFRRTGNYNRAGERIHNHRKQFKSNDGPRQQNKSSPKKEADSKAKPVKESETEEKADMTEADSEAKPEEAKKEPPKTRYDEVHPALLKCHICNKSMWDGRSFENHLSGRAHAIMMQKTAESYALTADTMRQEFKIREMKRTRKAGQQPVRDFYCAMCDMYAGDGGVHRTTIGHRKLKKYLHPTCTSCHKEMPTRIELDEHRLTAEHLKNMQEKQDDITKPKPEVMVISTTSMEQTFLREDRQRKRHYRDRNTVVVENADDTNNKEGAAENDGEKAPSKVIDTEKTIIDIANAEDLGIVTQDMFPAYSTERGVGASFLTEFKCVQCRLCNKLLDNEDTAQVHLRTWKHHQLFLKCLQAHAPQSTTEQQEPGSKRAHGSSDDGNWKRRRTHTDVEADMDAEADADAENGHEDNNIKKEPQVSEPLEADLSVADVDMPHNDELDDWEQSVDEILDDEKNNDGTEYQSKTPESPCVEEAEVKAEPEASPAPAPLLAVPPLGARSSPRRGRGRGRGRGRY